MQFKVPFEFIRGRMRPSWTDLQFGIDRQLIAPKVAIQEANQRLCEGENVNRDLMELASRKDSDSISELVVHLARTETPVDGKRTEERWAYLVLAWIFDNRDALDDPLALVEQVYSDFGYPREMACFVRYMPMQGLDLGNREANEARLIKNWEQYLKDKAFKFSSSPSGSTSQSS